MEFVWRAPLSQENTRVCPARSQSTGWVNEERGAFLSWRADSFSFPPKGGAVCFWDDGGRGVGAVADQGSGHGGMTQASRGPPRDGKV